MIISFVELCHERPTRRVLRGCAAAAPLLLAACAGEYSTLDPAGPAAAQVATLWWVMLAGSVVILAGVMATVLYALKPDRRGRGLSERRVLAGWGLLFPLVTLTALMAFAFLRGETLFARPDPAAVTIEATARQWSWSFAYPDGRRSENLLHVPAGETFHVLVSSEDVIHSFWVPRLGGKIDAVPGRVNRIALRADLPGRYGGECAEYCGIGHVHMPFVVEAHPPELYAAAISARTSADPDAERPPVATRRAPAADGIENAVDHLLGWLGIGG